MRARAPFVIALGALASACASTEAPPLPDYIPPSDAALPRGELRVEIWSPSSRLALTSWEPSIEVQGGASVFGGARWLELMLVLDSSKSLQHTDPTNYRSAGAVGLVESLPPKSDIRIGLVDFDSKARLVLPLTADRAAAVNSIRSLDRDGQTDLAEGIRAALAELERSARPDSSRVVLLFTDGKSNEAEARHAMEEARARGVAIHALLLGEDRKGAAILTEIAKGTGGSFVRVTDPAELPKAFLNLRTTGVESVAVRVNGSEPIPVRLAGGSFAQRIALRPGENRIVARATSLAGEVREAEVTLTVSGPLAVAIEAPADGTLVTQRDTELRVEGSVDPFAGLTGAAPSDSGRFGIRSVVLEVGDAPPFAAQVLEGRFSGRVLLRAGTNRIRAVATTIDGRSASDAVTVQVRAPGCGELEVRALREGRPALSVSERAVEIVLDGSNSMWGRMEGRPKIEIAKEILRDALGWLGGDVGLALRGYGHRKAREARDCTDSELLVPFSDGDGSANRAEIARAIADLAPKGQTPLAYSLSRVGADFGERRGERAVVLVTDGIESCGGDPREAAQALGQRGTPVHVIGFGLGSEVDEDRRALEAIARASGGRFMLARSAEELREALAITVGTPFRVLRDERVVAEGALGSGERVRIPEGSYRVRLESDPPQEAPVTLASEEGVTLTWKRTGGSLSRSIERRPAAYAPCWEEPPTLGPTSSPASPSVE